MLRFIVYRHSHLSLLFIESSHHFIFAIAQIAYRPINEF